VEAVEALPLAVALVVRCCRLKDCIPGRFQGLSVMRYIGNTLTEF